MQVYSKFLTIILWQFELIDGGLTDVHGVVEYANEFFENSKSSRME